MKTAGLAFMIGFAVLLYGTSHAAPFDPAAPQSSSAHSGDTASNGPHAEHAAQADGEKHQAGEKPSGEQPGNHRASGKDHPSSEASLTKANHPSQVPNPQQHSASGNVMNLRTKDSDQSGGAPRVGRIPNETGNRALPVRSPSVTRTTAPSLGNARHRGPNPAVVSGSANAATRSTGAINGALVKRKP